MMRLIGLLVLLGSVALACGTPEKTQSLVPTPTPADTPTLAATVVATPTPADTPTLAATVVATPTPADTPTLAATVVATPTPADTPTLAATVVATAVPTEEPTATPTVVATATPTEEPTATPTVVPTVTPTEEPTAAPTVVPTARPTEEPTATPTVEPVVSRQPADPDAPAGQWVAGVNAAGWGFHRSLTGNAVSSPMSIGVAFSLSRAGASADSGAALDEIFSFPEADTHGAANAVDLRLAKASVEPTTLEVANRLFPDDGFSPLPEFLHIASAQYGATIQPIDTANAGEAADTINRWVSESTRGLIPTIVDKGVVRDQELVLVNTVYLKADWLAPFLPEYTRDDQFTIDDGRYVTVPFMHDRVPVNRRFARLDDADAVELPYQGGELAMWLVVPHDPDGLAAVEESLDARTLTGLHKAAQEGTVDLTMPKWEQTLPPADLFEWLCPLGFCPGAGFSAIAPRIFMSTALHSAKVIVDEMGTEAAAGTATAFPTSLPPLADLTVVADRPFLWTIVHHDTRAILFVGRLVDPTG